MRAEGPSTGWIGGSDRPAGTPSPGVPNERETEKPGKVPASSVSWLIALLVSLWCCVVCFFFFGGGVDNNICLCVGGEDEKKRPCTHTQAHTHTLTHTHTHTHTHTLTHTHTPALLGQELLGLLDRRTSSRGVLAY